MNLCNRVVADDSGQGYYSDGWAGLDVARRTLRALALPYADHPDFDPAWRL